jgi:hypothetical protein
MSYLKYATDPFVVRDGEIIRQTYAGVPVSKYDKAG